MNFTEAVISRMGAISEEEAVSILGGSDTWNYYFMTRERLNMTDRVASRVSDRMER